MPGRGRCGKPKPGFPQRPSALGNRCAIPTFPQPPPPTFPLIKNQKKERRTPVTSSSPNYFASGSSFDENMLKPPGGHRGKQPRFRPWGNLQSQSFVRVPAAGQLRLLPAAGSNPIVNGAE